MTLGIRPQAQHRAAILACLAALLCSACMRVDVGAGGAVAMSPDGLGNCALYLGEMCRTFHPLTTATIEATPAAGYTFAGFYDADHFERCPGKTTCRITMYWPRAISAVFVPTAFTPKSVHLGRDGIVYLHDDERDLVHRWDVAEGHYWTPIRLGDGAMQVAYAADTHILFASYPGGAIQRVRLDRGGVREEAFASVDQTPRAIFPIGSSLFVARNYDDLTLLADGTRVQNGGFESAGTDFAWNAVTKRLFWPWSWSLGWIAIDPTTGSSTGSGYSLQDPDNGGVVGPIRWSPDGKRLFESSGDLYDATSLQVENVLPSGATDAAWLGDGGIALLRGDASQASIVERFGSDLRRYESVHFAGTPLRVFAGDAGLVVVTQRDGLPGFATHALATDVDVDGVANAQDGFPDDAAASLDEDRDGAPDAWNAGKSAADSSTGLSALDAFPSAAECQLPQHALADAPSACDFANGVPAYQPDPKSMLMDRDGVVHLLSPEQRRIFRWSASTQRHLESIPIGRRATRIVYASDLHRIYVLYRFGFITKIDLSAAEPVEQPFLHFEDQVAALATAGSYLVVGHDYVTDTYSATGVRAGSMSLYLHPADLTWNAAAGRLYWVDSNYATGPLRSVRINTTTGAITGRKDAAYDDPNARVPLRVSNDRGLVLTGAGELYDATSLAYTNSLPVEVADAVWLAAGKIATLRDAAGGQTRVEQWTTSRVVDDSVRLPGTPLRVFERSGALIVVTEVAGRPSFQRYVPSNDADHDGVANTNDAFPDDPAASLDTDRDGVPDAWNAGKGPADSTTDLGQLDAFPLDAACQGAAQAREDDPALCDIARAIPEFAPDASLVDRDGVIHLLSAAHARIFRWSIAAHAHLNPIPIGAGAAQLAYAADSHALYVGYGSGAITRMSLAGPPREASFAVIPDAVRGLATAGPIVVAVDDLHRSYRPDGTLVATLGSPFYPTPEQVWDPVERRLYFVSGNNFGWLGVDPATGALGSRSDVYHDGGHQHRTIRVSSDGALLLLGSGRVFDTRSRWYEGAIPIQPMDSLWAADGSLLTVREAAPGRSIAEEWSADRFQLGRFQGLAGAPLGLFEHLGERIVATSVDGRPAFHTYVSSDDGDGDGVATQDDDFPTDAAASLDTDRDGAPDAWNPGMGPADSATGLVDLDAFPFDSACQRADQALPGDATRCDIAGQTPAYTPGIDDVVAGADGTVYVLDRAHAQIRRWSIPARAHENPIRIGPGALAMTWDPASQHLFVAYDSGLLTEIAPESRFLETHFAALSDPVTSLVMAGDFLYVATDRTRSALDRSGAIVATDEHFIEAPAGLAWSAATNRIYAVPRDSYWAFSSLPIDPVTGALGDITASNASSALNRPPMRLAPDGTRILFGTGQIFDAATLATLDRLRVDLFDAAWLADGGTVTLRVSYPAGVTHLEEWFVDGRLRNAESVPGSPIRVVEHAGEIAVVTLVGGRPVFQIYTATAR